MFSLERELATNTLLSISYVGTQAHRLLVLEEAGNVVGYAGSHQYRPKRAYDTTAEVTKGGKRHAVLKMPPNAQFVNYLTKHPMTLVGKK